MPEVLELSDKLDPRVCVAFDGFDKSRLQLNLLFVDFNVEVSELTDGTRLHYASIAEYGITETIDLSNPGLDLTSSAFGGLCLHTLLLGLGLGR